MAFYEDLYQSNKNRLLLDKDKFLIKIADIIKILLSNDYTIEKPIWPPKSEAKDFNIKDLQHRRKGRYIHTSYNKTVLFKKKNNIRGGKDIRTINILPA